MAERPDQAIKAIASRTGLVTEMHTTKPAGDPFNDPAHADRRRVDLTEEANLSFPACFRDRDGVFQLCDVDSDKCFPIICQSYAGKWVMT
ncbi:hypothetical protein ACVIHI_008593 [Bradyrhizobium sp. USDA 4524]|nr:hypothetical protein [Bradyrhizobium sp. USDA 4538]MCP1907422.1 hypothetical protein [Bradyrhizobium sp. USDA 4537]MCP1985208.1 hypothetical protein [Bradyrhizobium sp. USDA 4539]